MKLDEALKAIARLEAEKAQIDRDWRRKWDMAEGRRSNGVACVPGFTATETSILRIMAARGRVAYEQIPCLQRHMCNIRKKLREQGRKITILTEKEIGYVVETKAGKVMLERMVMGAEPRTQNLTLSRGAQPAAGRGM